MIEVSCMVKVYEVNGIEPPLPDAPHIAVSSHGSRASLVVLEIEGKRLTVAAADLDAAIKNATNTNRYG